MQHGIIYVERAVAVVLEQAATAEALKMQELLYEG